jgi:hypothetical protein
LSNRNATFASNDQPPSAPTSLSSVAGAGGGSGAGFTAAAVATAITAGSWPAAVGIAVGKSADEPDGAVAFPAITADFWFKTRGITTGMGTGA